MFIATFEDLDLKMYSCKRSYYQHWARYSEPHIIDRYKMSLYIYRNNNYISVALCLMTGDHDEYNQWPFSKPVSFIIIHPDDNNRSYKKTLTRHLSHSEEFPRFRKPETDISKGHGFDDFITISKLNEGGYVKQETLVLRCELRF